MKTKLKIIFTLILVIASIGLLVRFLSHTNIEVLNPAGPIAHKERNLIFFALGLSLIVVVPVFLLTAYFAWHYRESNHRAAYSPNLERNRLAEFIWWAIPTILIFILSVVAWNSSHELDPYRSISTNDPSMSVQVIALDWKWLFIYPKQGIASVNYVAFPANTQVNFELTSDAPMNSFWIPQLGGQIYCMPGMSTQLHLLASQPGSYRGLSANISGPGFAGMNFSAVSTTQTAFSRWVNKIRTEPSSLSADAYSNLV